MRDNFDRCQKFISEAEGGANFDVINGKAVLKPKNRNDKGGPTKYGITAGSLKRAYSQGLVEHGDVAKLTKPEADRIYKENYWKPSRAENLPWGLCLVHYDAAVNSGVGGAAKLLQKAINELAGADIVAVDGVVGPASLAAALRADTDALTRKYLDVRERRYNDIAAKDFSQNVFLKGWLNRLIRLRKALGMG
jgi:lysozyme family protein